MSAPWLLIALVAGPSLGCTRAVTGPAVEPNDEPATPVCPGDEIAYDEPSLPVSARIDWDVDAPTPWSPVPEGLPRAPWFDAAAGLLVVPRPGALPNAPARWDVVSTKTGEPVQTLEIDDPAALTAEAAQWLGSRGLLDGEGDVPLRAVTLPEAYSRTPRIDAVSGWTIVSAPSAHGDEDLDPYYRMEIPGRCAWSVLVGDEADSVLPDRSEIHWRLLEPSLWVAPSGELAVFAVTYLGHLADSSGRRTGGQAHALQYRVLGSQP
ncbi:MAG: hypothetical protein K0V04_31565 [Deltaproteobacteria bacterium]|nr:hypothetical protein [Deltaproteobacteria bacterium]